MMKIENWPLVTYHTCHSDILFKVTGASKLLDYFAFNYEVIFFKLFYDDSNSRGLHEQKMHFSASRAMACAILWHDSTIIGKPMLYQLWKVVLDIQ